MSAFFQEFHLLRPWWLLGLLALPLLWRRLRAGANSRAAWARVVDAHLLDQLLAGRDDARRWPAVLAMAACLVALLALAGPAWERLPTALLRNQAARVIALELSSSMLASDVKPDRLSRARFKIRDLLRRMGDGQVALLGYAGDAFVVAPLTDDANTVENLLDALAPDVMPVAGNATERAIERGAALIEQAGLSGGDVILVADSVSPGAVDAARAAARRNVRVSVLAVGSDAGAPVSLPQGGFLKDAAGNILVPKLDADALRDVAKAGDGRYVELAADNRDLDALHVDAPLSAATANPDAQARTDSFRDRGPWLALLLLPLAAIGFRRGWLMVLALGLLPLQRAQAVGWTDLWQRKDQQAWTALQEGDAKRAQELAAAPPLHGAAAFKAGDFPTATQDFAKGADADAEYNRGNALAKQNRYEDAIAAYDRALERDPANEDARANRAAVEEWIKKQKQQNEQNKQNQKDGDKNQDHQGHDQPDRGEQGNDKSQSQDGKDDGNGEQADQKDSEKQPGKNPSDDQKAKERAGQQGDGKDDPSGQAQPSQDPGQADKQREFQRSMDQALKEGENKDAPQGKPVPQPETEPQREQRQAMEQLLQRVPDDPGGLLRRKFQLDYERRRQSGGREGDR